MTNSSPTKPNALYVYLVSLYHLLVSVRGDDVGDKEWGPKAVAE